MSKSLALSLPRNATSVTRARHLLYGLLASADVTDECREDLAVMITEACANAVEHGRGAGAVEMAITVDPDRCLIEIGNPDGVFDESRLSAGLPDPLAEGGRGLPLIGFLSDTVRILHPRPGWVLLRMTKDLVLRGRAGCLRSVSPPLSPLNQAT